MIDASKIKYSARIIPPDGSPPLHLDQLQRGIRTEENDGELAVRLEVELQNKLLDNGKWLHQMTPLGGKVVLLADWGEGWQETFRGTIFSWHYRDEGLGYYTITAYDDLFYLKSEDDRFYKAGTTGKAIIQDIARDWGIPLGTIQGPDVPLAKQLFRGERLSDMIVKVLDQTKKRGGGKWIVRSKQGKIDVIRPGQNRPVYHFGSDDTVSSMEEQWDIEDLVTRVRVVGAENNDRRATVQATHDGRTEFGILQKLVYSQQYDNLAAANNAAKEILDEQGKPRKRRRVPAVDLPLLRKGDKVHLTTGTLIGYYIVSSVTHDATNRIMVMEVEDVG